MRDAPLNAARGLEVDQLVTTSAAADILRVAPITIRRLVAAGKLHVVRPSPSGKSVRFRLSDLLRLMQGEGSANAP